MSKAVAARALPGWLALPADVGGKGGKGLGSLKMVSSHVSPSRLPWD